MSEKRDQWSGSFGFIMASAGSAVGLGNLWKFPYLAGMYGGGLFVLVYLVMVAIVGFTLILGELAIGRHAGSNAVSAFSKISPRLNGAGYLGIIASFVILSFYSVIGGWILKYISLFVSGSRLADTQNIFHTFASSGAQPVLWHAVFLAICIAIVLCGVSRGIEKTSSFMMPALLVMLVFIAIRGITLPGAFDGVEFYLKPDPGSFSLKAVAAALGQVFFSLSLGMGTLVTYGSYLSKKENLVRSTACIVGLDTLTALLSGFAVLPAVFAMGMQPDAGPPLIFITLPAVFEQLSGGRFIGLVFFVLVAFAAITSVISLLEVIITYFTERHALKRKTAALITASILLITGAVASLSQGPLEHIRLMGKNIFDFLDFLASGLLLPIGGLLLCITIGLVWKPKNAIAEITNQNTIGFRLKNVWIILIKYVMPVCIIFILIDALGILA